MFFKFHEEMRRIFLEDIDKHNILAWIIYNTNFQKEYEGLKKYQCFITTRNVSDDTKINHSKVQRILKTLETQGFISYIKKSKSKHESSIIYADFIVKNDTVNETVDETVFDIVDDTVNNTVESVEIAILDYIRNTVTDTVIDSVKNTVIDTVSDTSSRNSSNIYCRVISRLNKKASKRFSPTSKKNIALIQARINEGYSEADFYKVIDLKCNSWLFDETMNKYLRPETLFGHKFESYLNENFQEHPQRIIKNIGKEL